MAPSHHPSDDDGGRGTRARRRELLARWSSDVVVVVDDTLHIVEANDRTEEVLGYTRQELLSVDPLQLMESSTGRSPQKVLARELAGGRGKWEAVCRRKDGSVFPVEVEAHVEVQDGRRWIHGILRDITERRRAEEALRASEARFRAAFEGGTTGMALLDRRGVVLETNRAMRAMLGVREEEVRGRPGREFMDSEDAEAASRDFLRLRRGTPALVDRACRYRRTDGAMIETRLRLSPLADASGAVRYVLAVVEDVTEQRRMEAQLRLADRMASMGTLAAGVAHEINNPLAFVLANLEFAIRELRRAGTNADVVAALEEAREGGTRVREIVRDLKTFSRADDTAREPLDVGRVLRSALSLAANEIRVRARLEVELTPTPPVLASEHRLGQVFLNLLINAAQSIPEGRAASHRVRAATGVLPDGRVAISISDDGAGIAPEIRGRIFDPFFTTKPVGVGTGLGLSICHGIVTALGGEIRVESELGRGSTFVVALPAAAVEPRKQPPPAPAPQRSARLLIVDDEPLVCRALQRILSPPHQVSVQETGRGALAALESDGYDLVLCDLMMPDMSGMDLFGRVTARSPALADRFVFLTGGAFTGAARDFLQTVKNECVEKPFEPAALREVVNRLLARTAAKT